MWVGTPEIHDDRTTFKIWARKRTYSVEAQERQDMGTTLTGKMHVVGTSDQALPLNFRSELQREIAATA